MSFVATFEVYPEVVIGDLTTVEIETVKAEVSEAEIDKTIEILRKQRVHFHTKGEAGEHGDGGSAVAENGDRVTVDFVGSSTALNSQAAKPTTTASCSAKAACCRSSKPPPSA